MENKMLMSQFKTFQTSLQRYLYYPQVAHVAMHNLLPITNKSIPVNSPSSEIKAFSEETMT